MQEFVGWHTPTDRIEDVCYLQSRRCQEQGFRARSRVALPFSTCMLGESDEGSMTRTEGQRNNGIEGRDLENSHCS